MALLALKVLWDPKEKLEIPVWEDLQDNQGQEAYLDFLERMVKVDRMGNQGQPAQPVLLVKEDYPECQDYRAKKAIEGFLVLMVLKEMLEGRVKKGKKVLLGQWDHQGL